MRDGVAMNWTVKRVKDELPDVPVAIGSKRYQARVSGRLNRFATVTLSYVSHAAPREHLRGQPWADWHFSWDALVHALNTGNALRLE